MMTIADDTVAPRTARTGLGLLAALGASLAFGMSGSWARGLIDAGWSPGAAVTARVWIGALILLVPAIVSLRGRWRLLVPNAGIIVLYGLVAVAGAQLFYFQAVAVMDVAIALLVEYTAPVAVLAWLWARRGERPTRLCAIGALVAAAGLVLMLDLFGARANIAGILWALGAMVGAAVYFLVGARQDTGLPPIALAGGGLLVGAVGLTVAAAVGVLPIRWTTTDVSYRFGTVPWFVPLLFIGAVAAALAYVLGIAASRLLGSRLASFASLAEVAAALGFGWLLLGQLPGPVQGIGGALVLVGVVLVKLGEPVADAQRPAPSMPPPDSLEAAGTTGS